MTSLQRQAVLVCVVCALAALLTVGITLTLLKRGKPETPGTPADSVPTDTTGDGENTDLANHYQIDNTSSALLTETADAGAEYLDSTLFLGDSNTVRLYNNGLISLQQFCAKEGIGTQVALNEGIVTFKNDTTHYTIAQAVAKMKPRRVVMTFGTNDTGMEVADFISNYTALVQAIQEAYPYTDIIVNTVPPIPENHSNYPHMDQAKIDDFNMALLNMCEQLGVRFLNTAEVLKGENGYGQPDYYTELLAVVFLALAFYRLSSFAFRAGRTRRFAVYAALAIAFCLATLADRPDPARLLFYLGGAVTLFGFLLQRTAVLAAPWDNT